MSNNGQPAASNSKDQGPIFCHSKLDEAGLSPTRFRVYAHISRRGICTASAQTIAKVCGINRDTVFDSLRELEQRGMVSRESKHGRTTVIILTKMSEWQPVGKEGTPIPFLRLPVGKEGTRGVGKQGTPTRRKGGGTKDILLKDILLKDIPLRKSQKPVVEFPTELDTENFRKTWQNWTRYRKELRKPLTASTIESQIKLCAGLGEPKSIEAIEKSIQSGWTGIFEPKAHGTSQSNPGGVFNNHKTGTAKF